LIPCATVAARTQRGPDSALLAELTATDTRTNAR
jgi:hypothetical protein